MLFGAVMISGCGEKLYGPDSDFYPEIAVWYNDKVVNYGKIDVTEMPSIFDLSFFSNGQLKDVTLESNDPQCSVEIVSHSKPEYTDDGRLIGYTYVLRIDMQQEKSIKLVIEHHEMEWFKNPPCSVTLIRK